MTVAGARTARAAIWPMAGAFVIVMIGTTLPTPLYPAYEAQFGFANLTTTIVYAVYAAGVLAALLLLGRASDVVGRRPILLAGLAAAAASALVFTTVAGVPALMVGRILSGISAGIFTGTATVAITELAPPERRPRAALTATAANMLGLGGGPLLAGLLAQWAPAPLRLPYLVHIVLLAVALVAVLCTPETVADRGRRLPPPQRLGLSREARAAFVPGTLMVFAAFAVFGLLTAIEPAILREVLGVPGPAIAGTLVATMFTGSAAGQAALARLRGPAVLPAGGLVLLAGLGAIAAALIADSFGALIAANIVVGVGHGIVFRSAVAEITAASPTDRRGEVMSLFFVVSYIGLSVPVIAAGLAAAAWDLRIAGLLFTAAVALLTLAAMVTAIALHRRTSARP